MIWSWLSFAVGYVVGGLSALLVLGFFAIGGRDDGPDRIAQLPPKPNRNVVVPLDDLRTARNGGNGELPHDRSA